MTLIVAAKHAGLPFLLADSLVTGGAHEVTTQKIHRLRPDFVVGYAGHLAAAEVALLHLREFFTSQAVTFDRLRAVLLALPEEAIAGMKVELVGWFCDPTPIAFFWRSEDPANLRLGDEFACGSGSGRYLRNIVGGDLGTRAALGVKVQFETSILRELTHLIEDEIGARANRAARFGHSYEVLVWSDERGFDWFDDASIVFLDVVFDQSGRCISRQVFPTFFVLRHIDGVSISEAYTYVEGEAHRENVNFTAFTPFMAETHVDEVIRRVRASAIEERLRVRHSCVSVTFVEVNGPLVRVLTKVPIVSTDFDQQSLYGFGVWAEALEGQGDSYILQFRIPNVSFLEDLYRVLKEDMAKRGLC